MSKNVRMHHLASLLSTLSRQVKLSYQIFSTFPNRFKYRYNTQFTFFVFIFFTVPNYKYPQNACFRSIVFIYLSAVPNRFKYHQNACFRSIVFIYLSAVPNRFKYHQNACDIGYFPRGACPRTP